MFIFFHKDFSLVKDVNTFIWEFHIHQHAGKLIQDEMRQQWSDNYSHASSYLVTAAVKGSGPQTHTRAS